MDEGAFCRIINNLLLNAQQAMPDGGELSICAEEVRLVPENRMNLAEGPYLRIAISDTGCGIPEHMVAKVFDPYFTTKESGNGLGLASVKEIIDHHSAAIEIDSIAGKGNYGDSDRSGSILI